MTQVPVTLDSFLVSLGWTRHFQTEFEALNQAANLAPARVMGQGRGHYQVQATADGTFEAAISTKFHDQTGDATGFPTVGDWVTFELRDGSSQGTIHHVLPRTNLIQRQKLGAARDVQLIAANTDVVLAMTSLGEDLDLERLGRFVALGTHAECPTAIVLTKADLCDDVEDRVRSVKRACGDLDVFVISETDPTSIAPLEPFFAPGRTAVLVGPSGAGKSTLTNYLLGFAGQKTQTLSGNARGRHTTTARNLRITRFGGLVMDTPGMQEVTVGDSGTEANDAFTDVEDLTLNCKFTNCRHASEPGCAITSAIKSGNLSAERWAEYLEAKANEERRRKKSRPRGR